LKDKGYPLNVRPIIQTAS